MDYHKNARLVVHSREQLARLVMEQGQTRKAVALAFHVSQKTAAKWVRRYREQGAAGLRDRSSKPHRSPRKNHISFIRKGFVFTAVSVATAGRSRTNSSSAGPRSAASCVVLA